MFSFFRKKAAPPAPTVEASVEPPRPLSPAPVPAPIPAPAPAPESAVVSAGAGESAPAARQGWLSRLKAGLARTGSSIAQVFTGTQIDDTLYEELESALLMADAGVKATEHLLADLKRRVEPGQRSPAPGS